MAILEKLRVKAGLLVAIVIGLSLAAFILSDLLDSGGSLFTRSKYEIAEISGKSVPYTEYETLVNKLEEIQKLQSGQSSLNESTIDQIRTATWENMLQDMLLVKQYSKIGVTVSDEELSSLVNGDNPHPYISQLFADQQTGIINRQQLSAFLQRAFADEESNEKTYYLFIENEIIRERKYSKYLNLIRKGLLVTDVEAERQQLESSKTVDVDYIVQNFNTISDSSVQLSDKDVEKYYKENLNEFKQEESRDIKYIYFQVVPSKEDTTAALEWINRIKPDFTEAGDIRQFVSMESDESFDEMNYKNGELSDTINNFMFSAPLGASYGPYFSDGAYRLSRLASINYLPDSVKARHILLRATQTNAQTLYQKADSLADLIRKGSDFATLAMLYSEDGTAQTGGDLGWFREGAMVKSFSDSCFYGKKGDVKVVPSQYGLHIVQIIDQAKPIKKVQVGTIIKKVMASENTDHDFYIKANEFAGLNNSYDKFNKAIADQNLSLNTRTALNLLPMDKKVNDIESARPLVSWVYKAETHDVSTVFKINDKYIIATVEKVREKGPAPLNDVRALVENKVRQQKKAESIVQNMKSKKAGIKSLEELAKNMNLTIEPVSGLSFNATSLGNSGVEPNVIGAACTLDKGVLSAPVIGENGVYVLYVNNITQPAPEEIKTSARMAKSYLERNYAAQANYAAYEALKELADIKDNRREFY
jgi:peptidyl-prolyl cis-trans isomerase D